MNVNWWVFPWFPKTLTCTAKTVSGYWVMSDRARRQMSVEPDCLSRQRSVSGRQGVHVSFRRRVWWHLERRGCVAMRRFPLKQDGTRLKWKHPFILPSTPCVSQVQALHHIAITVKAMISYQNTISALCALLLIHTSEKSLYNEYYKEYTVNYWPSPYTNWYLFSCLSSFHNLHFSADRARMITNVF